jgi:hypothetical protein
LKIIDKEILARKKGLNIENKSDRFTFTFPNGSITVCSGDFPYGALRIVPYQRLLKAINVNMVYDALMCHHLLTLAKSTVLHKLALVDGYGPLPRAKALRDEVPLIRYHFARTDRPRLGNYKTSEELDKISFMRPLRRAWFLWDQIAVTLSVMPPTFAASFHLRLSDNGLPDTIQSELDEFGTIYKTFL